MFFSGRRPGSTIGLLARLVTVLSVGLFLLLSLPILDGVIALKLADRAVVLSAADRVLFETGSAILK
jgi:hypothetical protein